MITYIRNCYKCQRFKTSRDREHGLIQPLPIPQKRWQNIFMNFIVDLSQSKEHNVIFVVVNRLIKKRYYISCTVTDEDISVEYTAKMLVNHIFRLHELPSLIVSNRDPQFVITVWKSFCTRLDIITKLFIAFHSQTDDQTKRSNQDLERYLRTLSEPGLEGS